MRLSGLQRQVLGLYRQCLRQARKKPTVRGHDVLFCESELDQLTARNRRYKKISGTMPGISIIRGDCLGRRAEAENELQDRIQAASERRQEGFRRRRAHVEIGE